VKSGMLGGAAVVRLVAEAIRSHRLAPYVLDPVLVATSGDPLAAPDTAAAMREALIPLAELVTPNLDEAATLLGRSVDDVGAMRDAARALVRELGAGAALVRGGHLRGDELVDVLFDGDFTEYRRPRLPGIAWHGTGCTLSAAITAHRALGVPLRDAVGRSLDYVQRAIATAPILGGGSRPLNHWA
jgi:hydroxymethylpyrimidine/phosphomethylpyrimidine kinase